MYNEIIKDPYDVPYDIINLEYDEGGNYLCTIQVECSVPIEALSVRYEGIIDEDGMVRVVEDSSPSLKVIG